MPPLLVPKDALWPAKAATDPAEPRILLVSPAGLGHELGRTVLWSDDVARVAVRSPEAALQVARALRPRLIVVGCRELHDSAGLIRRLREDPETRPSSIVAFRRAATLQEEERLREAGASLVMVGRVEPATWNARLAELLNVPPRRSLRKPVRLTVWSRVGLQEESAEGLALDLSVHGMLLETARPLELGRKLHLYFALEDDEPELRVLGHVVRKAATPGRPRYGVEFLVLRGDARQRIRQFVETGAASASPGAPSLSPDEAEAWEVELRASEARKAALLDATLDAVLILDQEGRVVEFNRAAEWAFGYAREQAVGRRALDLLIPPERRERCREAWNLATTDGQAAEARSEIVAMRSDGSEFPAEATLASFPLRGKRYHAVTLRDVSSQRRAEEALRASERLFRAVFDGAMDGMEIVDSDGRIVEANTAAALLHGLDRTGLAGRRLDETIGPAFDLGSALRALRTDGSWSGECHVVRSDGTARLVEVQASAECVAGRHLVVLRDVTERRHLEEQLRLPQKMEAMGRLAGGVAHDFNNLLNVILGYAALSERRLEQPEALLRNLEQIRRAGERGARLTRQLLAFSRKQVLVPEVLDLAALVGDMSRMLERLIGEDIELETILGPDLGRVRADPGQIEQVILNLAVNARDAMPDGGRLTMEVRNIDLDEFFAREHLGARPGPHVMLAVRDTGIGMDADTRSHVFEPFFTTKEEGKGTGLGLATVYGIVKQSDGYIVVDSQPGRGAAFSILLPRVDEPRRAPRATPETRPSQGTETILVAEDDAAVRGLMREALESYGYAVVEASGGAEALALAHEHDGPIHLLLTDVVMLGMSGRALAEALARERPGLRVIFVSGYMDDALAHHGVLEPGRHFLQKPFAPDALARRVRAVLGE